MNALHLQHFVILVIKWEFDKKATLIKNLKLTFFFIKSLILIVSMRETMQALILDVLDNMSIDKAQLIEAWIEFRILIHAL